MTLSRPTIAVASQLRATGLTTVSADAVRVLRGELDGESEKQDRAHRLGTNRYAVAKFEFQ